MPWTREPGANTALGPGDADENANRKNMIVLIQLRWIAILGQFVTIDITAFLLNIDIPWHPMMLVLSALTLFNLASLVWLRQKTYVTSQALLLGLMLDVCSLSAQLWLSGGLANPFVALFLLQVTLAAILLDGMSTSIIIGLICLCFMALLGPHRPLDFPHSSLGRPPELYVAGTLVCLALDAALMVIFVTLIMRNLRVRDDSLAAMRQQAAEEDHIVRMGLLAAGAAHELGTPLASLSVILGDWREMPQFAGRELARDLDEMQAAVARCKTILTGVLLASGEVRGEAPMRTTICCFLDRLSAEWEAGQHAATLQYANSFGPDMVIVTDSALKQIIFNVLDNAAEAPATRIWFEVLRQGDRAVLRVTDNGPGFSADMLQRFGKPYQSSKGDRGGGLGLFLVVNVMRKFGGTVQAHNRPGGGAVVELHLPLKALAIASVAA